MAERSVLIRLGSKIAPGGFAGIKQFDKQIAGLENRAAQFGKYLAIGAGVAATAFLAKGVRDAHEFGKAMAEVSTLVDTSRVNMAGLNKEILGLSRETGKGPEDLAKALYQAISAGIPAGEAMQFLGEASKAAIGGVASVTDAVNLSTNVLNAYGMKASEVQRVNDIAFAAVKEGKTTYTELASNMGSVLPFASQLSVSLEDLFASVATLTKGGIDTANATTFLKGVLTSTLKPTKEASDLAEKLGLDFSSAALRAKGLSGFLADVREKTGGNIDAMASLFGNVRGLTAVMALAGTQSEEYGRIVDSLTNSQGAAGEAFRKVAESDIFKFDKALNDMKVSGIELGEKVLPSLTQTLTALAPFLQKAAGFAAELAEGFAAVVEGGGALKSFLYEAVTSPVLSPLGYAGRKMGVLPNDVGVDEMQRKAISEAVAAVQEQAKNIVPPGIKNQSGEVTDNLEKQRNVAKEIVGIESERAKQVAKIVASMGEGAAAAEKTAASIRAQYGMMSALERLQVRTVLEKLQGGGQRAFESLTGEERKIVARSKLLSQFVEQGGFAANLTNKELGGGLIGLDKGKISIGTVLKNEITAKLEIDGPSIARQITEKVLPAIHELVNAAVGTLTGNARRLQNTGQAVLGAAGR